MFDGNCGCHGNPWRLCCRQMHRHPPLKICIRNLAYLHWKWAELCCYEKCTICVDAPLPDAFQGVVCGGGRSHWICSLTPSWAWNFLLACLYTNGGREEDQQISWPTRQTNKEMLILRLSEVVALKDVVFLFAGSESECTCYTGLSWERANQSLKRLLVGARRKMHVCIGTAVCVPAFRFKHWLLCLKHKHF